LQGVTLNTPLRNLRTFFTGGCTALLFKGILFILIFPPDPAEEFFDDLGWQDCHPIIAIGVAPLFGKTSLSHPLGLNTSERGSFKLDTPANRKDRWDW